MRTGKIGTKIYEGYSDRALPSYLLYFWGSCTRKGEIACPSSVLASPLPWTHSKAQEINRQNNSHGTWKMPDDDKESSRHHAQPPNSGKSFELSGLSLRSWFKTPEPIKRLFDRFPIQIYVSNELPRRTAIDRGQNTLYVFTTDEAAEKGAPSYNPSCLKWQVCQICLCNLESIRHSWWSVYRRHTSSSWKLLSSLSPRIIMHHPRELSPFSSRLRGSNKTNRQIQSPQTDCSVGLLNFPLHVKRRRIYVTVPICRY